MFGPVHPRSQPQPGHVYDVAVVGAGLAGCELAWRLAGAGRDVLLVTQSLDSIGNLFQPAVTPALFPAGSLFEQARALAAPDGAPLDGWRFHRQLKETLEATSGIHLLQSCVRGLLAGSPHELRTWEGPSLHASMVALAAGSFLQARLLVGPLEEEAGRLTEVAYDFLADDLAAQGLEFETREDEAAGVGGALPYRVRYAVLAPDELDGFRVRRFEAVYALGRCTPGELTYAGALDQAARLAGAMGA